MADIILSDSSSQVSNELIKVLIADNHPLMHDALKNQLRDEVNLQIVGDAYDGEEAVSLARQLSPDVIVMDLEMPKLNGIEATRVIKVENPAIQILALTVYNDSEHILKALEAGAAGYVIKTTPGDRLVKAIRAVMDGDSVFSEGVIEKLVKHSLRYPLEHKTPNIVNTLNARELQIFKLASKGMKNKEIAQDLDLNLRTVKGYLTNIYAKLNVSSRTEALVVGLRNGLLNDNDIK
jgi:two-component system, NarL family, response regulator LiaR